MDYIKTKLKNENSEYIILILITLSALIIRLAAFTIFKEYPGDGPARATHAYIWSHSPYFPTYGIWLPGYLYLSGIFSVVINNPLISTRILNMILGTLTIPFFYLLTRSVYDRFVACLSTVILAFFPLHVGLSVTSLTEVSFVFEIITGTFLLILASETHSSKRLIYLFLSLTLLSLSIMTRNESWILIPLYPGYYFWKTKRKLESMVILSLLILFPILWMLGNYHHSGSFLPGYKTALRGVEEGATPDNLSVALLRLGFLSRSYMWWILPFVTLLGFLLNLLLALRKRLNAKQLLYFFIACLNTIFIIKFTMARGDTFWYRYILFTLIIMLPFGAYFIKHICHNFNMFILSTVIIILILSPIVSQRIYKQDIYLCRSHPQYIIDLAHWLETSTYATDYILISQMGWDASLLPLYFPEISPKLMIVSGWFSGQWFADRVTNYKPSLFIFREGDEKYKLRIEEILHGKISKERLIEKRGELEIYDIKDFYISYNSK